jgi:uroporphyrinogen-III synthase
VNGINLMVTEFISVHPHIASKDMPAIGALAGQDGAVVVFTSKHAVNAVADFIDRTAPTGVAPSWKVYCLSPVTQHTVAARFPGAIIEGRGNDATGLADVIIRQPVTEVHFFCGNKRRDALPEALREKGITVHEWVVYETALRPRRVAEDYEGIVFFSPSAVESFFAVNQPGADTVCFAIGRTTGDAAGSHLRRPAILSPAQDAATMIGTVINYYKDKA